MATTGHQRLLDTFVELADTLTDDFDVIEFLQLLVDRCVELFDVDAAGLLLTDAGGELRLVASSSEHGPFLELFQLQNEEGPCLEAFDLARPVEHADLAIAGERWPRFSAAAVDAGFVAVQALPMRLRARVIGALNLFRHHPGDWDPAMVRTAAALLDVATIGILQHRSIHSQHVLTEQLQAALHSRVVIEQAKGLIAERAGIDVTTAFDALRRYARQHNRKIGDLAESVIAGRFEPGELLGDSRRGHHRR
ncbi:GAF and ANTAR domain-containing protein [Haloechinothrix sp. LS1_15]|uniref:GAF and ANTAR domain-containing protein n=1 Tax=Haloechinothrix sp. LS1_15 TaxID=2652248 RepID=UPI00294AC565|nr:GAF and ANTAR domain-containing protein [Haloechinothrix sp. LS1_15]